MHKQKIFIGAVVTSLLFGLSTVAFAGSPFDSTTNAVGTEAGNWQFVFGAPKTKADSAAQNHVYDREQLALVGTEAGARPFNFGPVAGTGTDMQVAEECRSSTDASCKC